jgi:hypothetical protein
MAASKDEMEGTKRLMGALVRMKPKPHDEMKVGKSSRRKKSTQNKTKKSKVANEPD